jgi:hypothetical protein
MHGADLSNANLAGATLRQANLTGAKLDRTVLVNADLRGALLAEAALTGTVLVDAKLDRAVLAMAELTSTIFQNTSLRGAILIGATCKSVPMPARLKLYLNFVAHGPISRIKSRRLFKRAQKFGLTRTDVSYGALRRNMRKQLLNSNSPLTGSVQFTVCDLTGSDLSAADLRKADFAEVTLNDIHWNELTRWPIGLEPPNPSVGEPPTPPLPWEDLEPDAPQAPSSAAQAVQEQRNQGPSSSYPRPSNSSREDAQAESDRLRPGRKPAS